MADPTSPQKNAKRLLLECFDVIDVDGGGSIGFDEFKVFNASQRAPLDDKDLRKLFVEVDEDNSGEIDKDEFENLVARLQRLVGASIADMADAFEKKCYKDLFKLVGDGAKALSSQDFRGMLDSVNNTLNLGHSSEDIRKIFKDCDASPDGSIEIEGFEEVMRIMKGKSTISNILHAFNTWKEKARQRMRQFKKAFGESNSPGSSPMSSPTSFKRSCKECDGFKKQVALLEGVKRELEAQLAAAAAPPGGGAGGAPNEAGAGGCEHAAYEAAKLRAETAEREVSLLQLKLDQALARLAAQEKEARGKNCRDCGRLRQHIHALEAERNVLEQERVEILERFRKQKRVTVAVKTRAETFKDRASDLEVKLKKEMARTNYLESTLQQTDEKLKKAMVLQKVRPKHRATSPAPSADRYEIKDLRKKLEITAAALGIRTQAADLLETRLALCDRRVETRVWLESLEAAVKTAATCAMGGGIDATLRSRAIRVPEPELQLFTKNDIVTAYTAVKEYRIAHNEPVMPQSGNSPASARRRRRGASSQDAAESDVALPIQKVESAPTAATHTPDGHHGSTSTLAVASPPFARHPPMHTGVSIFADPEAWVRSSSSALP